MKKYGFVYIWYDRKHKRYYIGCRWGNVDDGYVCSSTWMKNAQKRRPQDFKRRILETNIVDRTELIEREYAWLQKISDSEIGTKYYNLYKHHFGHWSTIPERRMSVGEKISRSNIGRNNSGTKWNEESKKRASQQRKGRPSARKGVTLSDETRQKISNSKKGFASSYRPTEQHKQLLRDIQTGKHHSDETRQKISDSKKGKRSKRVYGPLSEETKQKIRDTQARNRKQL